MEDNMEVLITFLTVCATCWLTFATTALLYQYMKVRKLRRTMSRQPKLTVPWWSGASTFFAIAWLITYYISF